MAKIEKARFWTAVLYQENMRSDWREEIGNIVQIPYAYCEHTQDKDSKSEHRKDHLHIILAFPNTTTYKHAMNVFSLLSAEDKQALNKCEAVVGIRNVYDYLIHDTEDCRKKGKTMYPTDARVTGNNFDIGAYEQLGIAEKNEIFKQMSDAIKDYNITNYMDFYEYVVDTYDDVNYLEVMRSYSSHFERMTKGNYQRWERAQRGLFRSSERPSQAHHHEITTEITTENIPFCCPKCGSVTIVKNGKTQAGSQKWVCKDCGKKFV